MRAEPGKTRRLRASAGGAGRSGAEVGAVVAMALRRLRTEQGLSLRTLAERSGVAVNTLSLIENRRVSPSVFTLQRIAVTLDVPVASFLDGGAGTRRIAYVRATKRVRTDFAHGSLEDLGAGIADRAIEPFVITLRPGSDSGSAPIVHGGLEFVFCLDGAIDYFVEGRPFRLTPGDSLLFEAELPHRWANACDEVSVGLLVFSPAGGRDRRYLRRLAVNEPRPETGIRRRRAKRTKEGS